MFNCPHQKLHNYTQNLQETVGFEKNIYIFACSSLTLSQPSRYLLSRLEQLVSEDYILVYLSGGRNVSSTSPSFHWLKTAYQMIDRKLKKNLRALLVVHPTLWVRTIVALTRPFIRSDFRAYIREICADI